MLGSVSTSVNTGAQASAQLAAESGATASAVTQTSLSLTATDQVYFSVQAQQMLAAATVLTSFEASSTSSQAGAPAKTQSTEVAVSGAANIYVGSDVFDGRLMTDVEVAAPATGDDVLDVGAFSYGAGSFVQALIKGGDGNDTYNIASNGQVRLKTGNGNDTVNVSIDGGGFDFAEVDLGSGNDVAHLVNSGIVVGGAGTDTINLSFDPGHQGLGAIGVGGSGTTTINGLGTGYGEAAWGGTGVTTINNVTGIDLGSFSSGTTTANLADNENSTVNLAAGFGVSVINLGKSTLGTNTTTFNLHGITADQISSVVSGSTLTMTIAGSSLTINNYQPGSLNFIYGNDYSTASATPPGLAQVRPVLMAVRAAAPAVMPARRPSTST